MKEILAALVGAIVGGGLTFAGGYYSYLLEGNRKKKESRRELKSLIKALAVEASIVWEHYLNAVGRTIEETETLTEGGQPVGFQFYRVAENYFPIYNVVCPKLGQIKQNDLREAIVKTYTQAKGMVDTFNMNNFFFEVFNRDQRPADRAVWVGYYRAIRRVHFELKTQFEEMQRVLKQHGYQS